ncbi:hypothetical protein CQW23_04386 [Capsicum baccatum]|uniref:Uncharacterized protein n=1 Tax=Capsicum baccatum TaxID=33114 RepID=A0A2G2XEK3_CAPBA|nr:hypothetical protein CQW23_04386 [Capsicum baccatum]
MDGTSAERSSAAPAVGGSSRGGSGTPLGHPSNRRKRKAKTVKSLLVSLGVNPKVFNMDGEEKTSMLMKLSKMNEGANSGTGGPWELPAVYIGGNYL